jgi:penicillin-binding protein 1A
VAAPAFAYFYRSLLELTPAMPRQFPVPEGVYVGEVDGHKELYTKISPLPAPDSGDYLDEGFLPHPPAQKSDGALLEEASPLPGAAEPVLSSEDPVASSSDDEVEMIPLEGDFEGGVIERDEALVDPLHPPKRRPEEVGADSGSLF